MDTLLLKIMNRFHPDGLGNRFYDQFVLEYGEKKMAELSKVVKNSDKVSQYINYLISNNRKPGSYGLQLLMNSISYFAFSKEETLCMGALGVFIIWKAEYIYSLEINDILEQEEIENQLTSIIANLIWDCSINKYNKFDNFFIRFFNNLYKFNKEFPEN